MDGTTLKKLETRVDEVLYYVWDPIGVSDDPYARSEYHTYISSVLDHVKSKNAQEIADYLCSIERDRMELTPNKEKALETAMLLLECKEAIEEGCV